MTERIGPWHIFYDPPPIPARCADWHWHHDSWEPGDPRAGSEATREECLQAIRDYEEENTP